MVRKGFRRRLPRYVVYLAALDLSWCLLAVLFDAPEVISYLWKALPLAILLLVVIEVTIDLKVPEWVRKWKLPHMVFWGSCGLALVVWVTSGYWWMAIPIVSMLAYLYRHRLMSVFLGHGGNQAVP